MYFIFRLVGIFIIMIIVMLILSFIIPSIVIMSEGLFVLCGLISLFFAVVDGD